MRCPLADPLRPDHITLLEGRARQLMGARGYAVIGPGHRPGPAERLRLGCAEKIGKWCAGMDIYDPGLCFAKKLRRTMHLPVLHPRLLAAMNLAETARLK